jgi:hypothetical protein
MKRITIEELMKRRAKRKSAFQPMLLNKTHIQNALQDYLERLPVFKGMDIIEIDIPALTTEHVDIKVYYKEPERGQERP